MMSDVRDALIAWFIELLSHATSGCSVVVAHTTPAMAVCWGSSNGMQANFVSKMRDRNSPIQGNRIVTQCSILK
jgi:hypothetical protein